MRITRLRIVQYRGIEQLDTTVAPAGLMATGSNGTGKTTILRAIQAALSGRDIGPEAIRLGADRAEILIDMDDLSVQRVINPDGSRVSVERDLGGVRAKIPSPAKFLRDLIGVSGIDPLDLLQAHTAEERRARRAKILAAIPTHVTAEQIEAWTGESVRGKIDQTTHGLEIIAQLRQTYYERRTEANAKAKEGRRRANELAKEVAKLPEKPEDAPSHEEAWHAREEAERALALLEMRAKAAQEADERTRSTRAKVEDLRERAAAEIESVTEPTETELDEAVQIRVKWEKKVLGLEAELQQIEVELAQAKDGLAGAVLWCKQQQARVEQARAADQLAKDLRRQASDLESAISAASVDAPTDDEIERATLRLADAQTRAHVAAEHEQNDIVRGVAFDAEQAAKALETEADKLDRVVQKLTKDAPAELLASADGIPGLTVDGDKVFLDNVDLDGLNVAKQLEFAVELARRANIKSRILVIDGLERLASDQLDRFIRLCTRDGYQLLCSRVSEGRRVVEALHVEQEST